MRNIIRLSAVVLLVALAIAGLWGFLARTSTAAEGTPGTVQWYPPSLPVRNQVFSEKPGFLGPLHYKSRAGLMPPAYGLSPQAPPSLMAADASSLSFLSPYTTTTVGSWPQVLALADLTGDDRTDAAVAAGSDFDPSNDEQLHLFAAQAGDFLSRTQRLPAGADPEAIIAADLNADGHTDVALALAGDDALAFYTQTLTLALSDPVTQSLPGAPNGLAAGNLTGDLYPDLAAVAPLSATIHLWEGSARGLVPLPFALSYPTGGYDALAAGDLDNDGDDDIVALRGAGYLTESVVVYLQDSDFFPLSYTLTPETGGYLPHSLAIGDVNGDGRDDLLVTAGGNTPDACLNVFLQEAGGLATVPITYSAFHLPSAVAVGDLNHDGREDIAVLHDAWQTLSVYTQTVRGTLSAYATAEVPYSDRYRPHALALADLDGNGGLDVALVDRDHGLIVLTNTLTAPTAAISQPLEAEILLPSPLTISGIASAEAITVEVRLRGFTDWVTATLVGGTWQISVTLPSEGRAWWIEARATDAQRRVQVPPARRRIGVEDGSPRGQITINDGAYATNQPTVTLTLQAYDIGGVDAMRFSLDTVCFTDWLAYGLTYTWTLPSGDGLKTLHAQFRDVQDNVSDLISDTIVLDTLPPASVIATLPVTVHQAGITLTWTGEDAGSGISSYDIQMRDGTTGTWTSLLEQTSLTQTAFQAQSGHTYCFRSRATDRAGNVEAWPPGDGDTCFSIVRLVYLPLILRDHRPNHPPNSLANPMPPDGATGQSVNANLSWNGGDPDGDSVAYDVYLEADDSTPDVLICDDITNTSCDPGPLSLGTRYYWQVIATDEYSATTVGPVWAFTTTTTIVTGWQEVGTGSATGGGISDNDGDSRYPAIATAPDGTPTIAWQDTSDGDSEIYVQRWNGSSWEEVGTGSASGGGISNNSGDSEHPSVATAPDGTLYVAWDDDSSGDAEIYVLLWNGSNWEEVGAGSASGGGISGNGVDSRYPSIAIAPDGTPYVVWQDSSSGDDEVYLRRWNGSAWEEVGVGSASGSGISDNSGDSWFPAVAIAPDGTPYVAWQDYSGGGGRTEVYVRRWNGNDWEEVGSGSASGGGISNSSANSWAASIAIAPDGTPYIAWHDHSGSMAAEVYVRRWNGSDWQEVGTGSASGGGISDNSGDSKHPSLAIAPDGTPYVAWHDWSSGNAEIYARRWNENEWEEVGADSASDGGISNNDGRSQRPAIAVAPDGTPYVVWHDDSAGDDEIYVRRWIE